MFPHIWRDCADVVLESNLLPVEIPTIQRQKYHKMFSL
uniref:Uncharacterized protein n=1 Tax=Arundo donax TaxID=35708 RepID=A0A0A9AWW8_ARUDO